MDCTPLSATFQRETQPADFTHSDEDLATDTAVSFKNVMRAHLSIIFTMSAHCAHQMHTVHTQWRGLCICCFLLLTAPRVLNGRVQPRSASIPQSPEGGSLRLRLGGLRRCVGSLRAQKRMSPNAPNYKPADPPPAHGPRECSRSVSLPEPAIFSARIGFMGHEGFHVSTKSAMFRARHHPKDRPC